MGVLEVSYYLISIVQRYDIFGVFASLIDVQRDSIDVYLYCYRVLISAMLAHF